MHPPTTPDDQARRIAFLISGFLRQSLSKEEHEELDEWVGSSDQNMYLFEELTDETKIQEALAWMESIDTNHALENVKKRIHFSKSSTTKIPGRFWQYAIAASLILLTGLSLFLIVQQKSPAPVQHSQQPATDFLPGGKHATLQTGATSILLDKAAIGKLQVIEGAVSKTKEGELQYTLSNNNNPVIHTLTTPPGGEYKVVLPDGSAVWLNAASSLKYPVPFNNNERVVEVTGEAFFEVTKKVNQAFRVKKGDVTIEVLGTDFNVNTYPDEPFLSITLIEGSILFKNQTGSTSLTPLEQARVAGGRISKSTTTDIEDVIAWKNGMFSFTDASIETVMRQVARWYNIEVRYEASITKLFTGKIYRNSNASQVLRMLEVAGDVKFKTEGNTIIVMKQQQ